MSTLTCGLCYHVGLTKKQVITVHDKDYVESIRSSTKWSLETLFLSILNITIIMRYLITSQ